MKGRDSMKVNAAGRLQALFQCLFLLTVMLPFR